jgi:lipopolysaccharide transport system permease protein
VAYLLAVTRDPIMGTSPQLTSWAGAMAIVAVASVAMAYIYTRYRSRVVYWA